MALIIGRKIEMNQLFDSQGEVVPVTLVKVEDSSVTRIVKPAKSDSGTNGTIVVGINERKTKSKASTADEKTDKKDHKVFKIFRSFKVNDVGKFKVGGELKLDEFKKDEIVKIFGVSKGKGFQGVVKRHKFHGDMKTHGRGHTLRKPGSLASKRTSKVAKGKKMAGRMGGERVCVHGHSVAMIYVKEKIIAIKGAVPGHRGSLVEIMSKA
jgi:large subunit ribosomal protein L3